MFWIIIIAPKSMQVQRLDKPMKLNFAVFVKVSIFFISTPAPSVCALADADSDAGPTWRFVY